jgi:hypothetical protein
VIYRILKKKLNIMSKNRVLDYRSYHKLNEADEAGSISAADQMIDLFMQAYGALVTKIGDYKEAGKDLTAVADSDNKGQGMLDAINKIAGKVDPKYKESATAMVVAGKKLKEAYDTLLKSDEQAADKIKDTIYKKTIAYITQLGETAKEAPKVEKQEGKDNNSLETGEQGHLYLFEKNTFTDEREELVKKITPILSQVLYLAKNSPVESLKSECLKIARDLEAQYVFLSTEREWESLKRRERKDKLEEILGKINEVPARMNEIQGKALVKLGIDSKVQSAIKTAMDLINKAIETLNKSEEVAIVKDAGKEVDAKKEEKKADSKPAEEIKSGNVSKENLSKKGKNFETIQKYQEKINTLLGDKQKIKADGLYGKNTETAIQSIASKFSSLVPELKGLDGKAMSPAFIKFLDKYEENKDKVAELFK